MAMTRDQLLNAMLHQLTLMAGTGNAVTTATAPKDVLSSQSPGPGMPSAQTMFKKWVNWVVVANGGKAPKWPAKWSEMPLTDIADDLHPKI